MKRSNLFIPVIIFSLGFMTSCSRSSSETDATMPPEQAMDASQFRSGIVSETMNSGGYTYVLVDDGMAPFWAAAPEFDVSVGQTVSVPAGMPMENYHSSTLNRDFDVLHFVQSIQTGGETTDTSSSLSMPPGHPDPALMTDTGVDYSDIAPLSDGYTIEAVFAQKNELDGQEISLRGKVVKFNPSIMGTNWLHVRDGTGSEGSNDLTITSDATVTVGQTVIVKGILSLDRDLGGNYFFPVIVENAEVVAE